MDFLEHNREAWNHEVLTGNQWTIPVTKIEIEAAIRGEYKLVLTPYKPIPADWLGNVQHKQILCLAMNGRTTSDGDTRSIPTNKLYSSGNLDEKRTYMTKLLSSRLPAL